jgi:hypothetical protein
VLLGLRAARRCRKDGHTFRQALAPLALFDLDLSGIGNAVRMQPFEKHFGNAANFLRAQCTKSDFAKGREGWGACKGAIVGRISPAPAQYGGAAVLSYPRFRLKQLLRLHCVVSAGAVPSLNGCANTSGAAPSHQYTDAADEIERLRGLLAEHPTTQLKVLWATEDIEHLRAENELLARCADGDCSAGC